VGAGTTLVDEPPARRVGDQAHEYVDRAALSSHRLS
jgi:hypothetical protein